MPGTLSPSPWLQFEDENGDPYAGARLFTYAAGTTTKLATYTDSALSVAHANPATLDAAGRIALYLTAGAYKFVLAPATDTDPPTSPYKTQDHIDAVSATADNLDVTGTAGETLLVGEAVYLSAGDGGRTAGRWYKADADLTYSSSLASVVGVAAQTIVSGATGALRIQGRLTGLVGLTAGATYYVSATAGALTASAPTNRRLVGMAESATVLFIVPITSPPGIASDGTRVTGIGFPATQVPSTDVNVLDDYEEGSWIPTIGGSGGQSGQTYTSQVGTYQKIGSWVDVQGFFSIATVGTITGNVQIKGFPFPMATSQSSGWLGTVTWQNTAVAISNITILATPNAATLYAIGAAATTAFGPMSQSQLASDTRFYFALKYQTTG